MEPKHVARSEIQPITLEEGWKGSIKVQLPPDDPDYSGEEDDFEKEDDADENNTDEEDDYEDEISHSKPKETTDAIKLLQEPQWLHKEPKSYSKFQTLKPISIKFEKYSKHTPVKLFEKLFTDKICRYIIDQSLCYADQKGESMKLSLTNFKIFIGILLFSTYHKLPLQQSYWSNSKDLGVGFVKKVMKQDQFLKIKKFLHFNDNSIIDQYENDKAFKIRLLLEKINKSCQQFGIFDQNLCVDEMTVRDFGHNRLKQFVRGKPIQSGYKLWALCGSDGYCYNFDLYCGADKSKWKSKPPLGTKIVLEMLKCVPKPASHVIYFDHFFTTYNLLVDLREKGFRATGTIPENQIPKCPLKESQFLQNEGKGAHDYQFDTKGEILIVRWNDFNCITVATNHDTIKPLAKVTKRSNLETVTVKQPKLIKSYNQNIGGVDRHNWYCEKYPIGIKGQKWYWCIFTRILSMTVVNSWIIYRHIHGKKSLSLLEYYRKIVESYLNFSQK